MNLSAPAEPTASTRRDHPASNRDPINFETELAALPLQGTLPAGLRGALVRNGPNPLLPEPGAHLFAGDGMLHAFHIADGRVGYRNRWVRTANFAHVQQTGRNLKAGNFVPASEGGVVDDGAANTHVIHHAGRMLALEEAHLPIEMDLATLATLGATDFDGAVTGRFTAHPKADPETGELLFFGYGTPQKLGAGMAYGVISPEGRVTRFEHFEAPYASMVHDFAVTKRHVVFPVMPLTASLERARSGRPPYAWEPSHGTRVGIMPRNGSTADIVWWTGPACYVFHVMNAWEEEGPTGERLVVDVIQFDQAPLFPLPDGSPAGGSLEGRLVRWTFDLADRRREFSQAVLEEISGEFPRIDDRRAGLPYRHGWYAGNAPGADGKTRSQACLVHVDHAAPRADVYTFAGRDRVSEPVFVPRADDAPEGDGWVLATVWRADTDTSALVVFDACCLAAGPVCTASLPHRVPDGFHGSWFPAGSVVGSVTTHAGAQA